ncbi:hypothetical protein AN639_09480 [Candidatus Epulonipiscium fishelsonii]|uniref:Uncharacterized protein n=1 Tax=Candidatus Epulonipiscium fishelsonii TaxID=77094 RepID=A0ACC8XE48_9FIRM|nr:hypothetical protein AN639_09480 [Epulopiscium sp. SCG-B05WGA-EpuloA1]ONI41414.1 hypothetical protein AN396_03590 [Epulopiscium sp. SCG-B11WGA-EpuloA1]
MNVSVGSGSGTITFMYDNAGNLIKDNKATYHYNEFNQTTKVETFDGNIQINRYDSEHLRYEIEENSKLIQFIFNTNREVIAEKETTWTTYIRTSELIASSADYAKTFYHYASDEMGSITHITQDENILNSYQYDAWGEVVNQTETIQNRFKFNGQQLDPITQQYYLRARYYKSVIARFTQEDTYRGDGLNLYAYCANNPVTYVDPSEYKKKEAGHKEKENNYAYNIDFLNFELGSVTGYKFKENNDINYRKTSNNYKDAIDEAFIRTGEKRKEFYVTKWRRDVYGKSFPVEWRHKSGAEVNIDAAHKKKGPDIPHIGYQTGGKRGKGELLEVILFFDMCRQYIDNKYERK